ncbi:hypothetical protein CMI39_00020 [Candidatus Pacearchaeota archaeon]|jgi:uncharacterized protein (UPF0332 family)|nr:hypothetical protein [Candidatus Pacearchaeota archaeon]|tara:strand:+ start:1509 stop:1940 length:432 start_codon:yes stop_codon:yes gene_type:complete
MIKEFQYYINNNLVRKGSPDKIEAEALIKKAEGRIKFSIKTREINENTAPYIFEDIYECLREASQSLMSLKGYKPYSHEVIISFFKKFCNFEEQDVDTFNRYRILRNKTIYRGERVSSEKCKEALNFLVIFLPKIKKEFILQI